MGGAPHQPARHIRHMGGGAAQVGLPARYTHSMHSERKKTRDGFVGDIALLGPEARNAPAGMRGADYQCIIPFNDCSSRTLYSSAISSHRKSYSYGMNLRTVSTSQT